MGCNQLNPYIGNKFPFKQIKIIENDLKKALDTDVMSFLNQ